MGGCVNERKRKKKEGRKEEGKERKGGRKTAKEAENEWPERWAKPGKHRVSGGRVWSAASNSSERTRKIEKQRPWNLATRKSLVPLARAG